MTAWSILTDTTRCVGCDKCVDACKHVNGLAKDVPSRWVQRVDDLSSTRYTTVIRRSGNHFVRDQCRHCLQPACVSACPVGAMQKTAEGPVIYDRSKCIGCRYCMVACPYGIPRYDWDKPVPSIRKCTMCYERLREGGQPACVEACPQKATLFGQRDELLAKAHRMIRDNPGRYIDNVFGETETGGTSVVYISDIPLDFLASGRQLDNTPLPARTWAALAKVPPLALGVGGLMLGAWWVIGRRMKLAKEAAQRQGTPHGDPLDPSPPVPASRKKEGTSGKSKRLTTLKTVLWTLMGVLAVVTFARFRSGLGATTALSNATPWGFWIAFDVMAGVALAAGGFVVAATVYIFGRENYRPFARPAILTAFLGYAAVVVGLIYDLGLPWNIWHPIIYPQYHSVLFEVALCVMLYLTVLALEFAPSVLEHPWFDRPPFRGVYKFLKGAVIPLVILGIVLSTLHQSSLGSLFLITPYRLHPLWYSPIMWVLFFISAVGLGLMMATAESFFSAAFFGHRLRMDLLSRLGRSASVVLFLYAGVRLGDLAIRGKLAAAFDGSPWVFLFLFELSVSALIPATLLLFRRVRANPAALAACAGLTILGMIGYRFDVCVGAFFRRMAYWPSWMELAVSLGIVAGVTLVFIFFVERLKISAEEHRREPVEAPPADRACACSPCDTRSFLFEAFASPLRYSLAFIIGAAVTVALLPPATLSGQQLVPAPVAAARTMDGWMQRRTNGPGHLLNVAWPDTTVPAGAQRLPLLVIDGSRNGRFVLFPHDYHVAKLGGQPSCGQCHHQNMPFDHNTSCSACHRDMYAPTDLFDHSLHISKLQGNDGCIRCHQDPRQPKTRDTARPCAECHADMIVPGSLVKPPKGPTSGLAVGYADAMHGLCIPCHEQKLKEGLADQGPGFAQCANCHRDTDAVGFYERKPYTVDRMEK